MVLADAYIKGLEGGINVRLSYSGHLLSILTYLSGRMAMPLLSKTPRLSHSTGAARDAVVSTAGILSVTSPSKILTGKASAP